MNYAGVRLMPQTDESRYTLMHLPRSHARRVEIKEYANGELVWWRIPDVRGRGVKPGNERHDCLRWLVSLFLGIPNYQQEAAHFTDDQREVMISKFVVINEARGWQVSA